ncbi:SDR family NAD(P)-dependent oxidoreductase [Nitratireductor sp. CH_MIT9313-5]|uniref:SDR family NAD(P)-dependent oxidoreductase n=1 Tax=Nitratireductor sp. CH_MIT9313-5 TaxID=3107764 RepID=UPI0030087EB7
MNFKGKTILVTGAASGIGNACAAAFVEAGGTVILTDINEAGGEAAAKALMNAHFMKLDVTSREDCESLAGRIEQEFGRLDILVNAAGWDIIQPFMDNTPEYWAKIMAINFMGPVQLTRALLPLLIESGSGRIVNVSSDAGRVGSFGETVYAGAKGGIIAFTKSLAREMTRKNIRVNCICPGPTDTPLFASQSEKMQEALKNAIPMKRVAKPSEVADGVLFFASDRSSFVTGQVLSVSGGLTMVD